LLFGHGTPANSFMPPQVPFYDPTTPGLQYDMAKAKQEIAKSKYPKGFKVEILIGKGAETENAIGQVKQQSLKELGIDVHFRQVDTATKFDDIQNFKYQIGFSYWTMDIADPDELVTFSIDPAGGAHSFFTDYKNPAAVKLSHQAQRTENVAKRRAY